MGDAPSEEEPSAIIDRLVQSVNDGDLEALVACFDADYVNETPAHPERSFRGNEQVRRNWTQILGHVPDLRADVLQTAVTGDRVWTEWEMDGTRNDGERFQMAGVVIFGIVGGTIKSARFYLEPVEKTTGDADAAVDHLTASERVK
jgi:ketosteroid isomerase-like protein